MNTRKRWAAWLLALCMALAWFPAGTRAAAEDAPGAEYAGAWEEPEEETAELAASNDITIVVGQKITLTAGTYERARSYYWLAQNSSGTWVSDNSRSDIVSVDYLGSSYSQSAVVRGLKAGTTKVRCNVTAYDPYTLRDLYYENTWNITVLPNSGPAGSKITWTLSISDKKLSIRGTGAMNDYIFREENRMAPWIKYLSSIQSIEVSDGVTSIGNYAFDSLNQAKTVKLGRDVSEIGEGAFIFCTSLSSITLPDGVKTIQSIAFGQCTGLSQITIPASVERIEYGAFYNCPLETVRFQGTEVQWKRIQIDQSDNANSALASAKIICEGGTGLSVEDNFDNRTAGVAEINCDHPLAGDFTVSSALPCVVFYHDGTHYVRLAAEPVASGGAPEENAEDNPEENPADVPEDTPDDVPKSSLYGFTLPENADETIRIIVAVRCDLNGDGAVTEDDAVQVLRISGGARARGETDTMVADIDGNGRLTSTDALQILRLSKGQRTISW